METIKLGIIDKGHKPNNFLGQLTAMHSVMHASFRNKERFRDNGKWFAVQEKNGTDVQVLQQFLHEAGFMPHNKPTGVFDYVTLSAARLFQEYVRTVEGISDIGKPDGIVGTNTWKHIDRWKRNHLKSSWGQISSQNPSEEYTKWLSLMKKAKAHFQANPHPILKMIDDYPKKSDTRKLNDWSFDSNEVHLIGIRCKENVSQNKRVNDDLFILLLNGLVFKFWGSTDPSASMASRSDEAFLIESQHVYRFGWHKISDEKKVYKALKPATNGVLVFRDLDNDNALTQKDIAKGIQPPNNTINIHWSGVGSANFSAGCQVIAGQSYINNEGKVVDCSAFASRSYAGLQSGQTRGAYNVIGDLILAYSAVGTDTILYTLGRDGALDLDPSLGEAYASQEVKRMKS